MNKFRQRLERFMQGRYGSDRFGRFLSAIYSILFLINLFVRSPIIYVAILVIISYVFFRTLSRNIYARNAENRKYLACENKVRKEAKLFFDRTRDLKKRVYKKCPSCKAVVRLPRRSGKHFAVCPACKHRFSIRILPFYAVITIIVIAALAVASLAVLPILL